MSERYPCDELVAVHVVGAGLQRGPARIELLLSEPRLPAINLMWATLAARADKEGCAGDHLNWHLGVAPPDAIVSLDGY